jgi:hypothetical protein
VFLSYRRLLAFLIGGTSIVYGTTYQALLLFGDEARSLTQNVGRWLMKESAFF